jgi:hypothetical protein
MNNKDKAIFVSTLEDRVLQGFIKLPADNSWPWVFVPEPSPSQSDSTIATHILMSTIRRNMEKKVERFITRDFGGNEEATEVHWHRGENGAIVVEGIKNLTMEGEIGMPVERRKLTDEERTEMNLKNHVQDKLNELENAQRLAVEEVERVHKNFTRMLIDYRVLGADKRALKAGYRKLGESLRDALLDVEMERQGREELETTIKNLQQRSNEYRSELNAALQQVAVLNKNLADTQEAGRWAREQNLKDYKVLQDQLELTQKEFESYKVFLRGKPVNNMVKGFDIDPHEEDDENE